MLVWVNRRCSFEAKVPESLKCQGCVSWAQTKNLALLSVLFCRRKEHAELRSPFPDIKKIKIGNSEVLNFFDRGANIHIIDGSLAEREGLQKVSSNPTNLTVLGGRKVRSNH